MGRLSPKVLEECVQMAIPILKEVAREGPEARITYGDLMKKMNGRPGRGYIGEVVGKISEIEWEKRQLKPSALAVHSGTGMVSGGFFGLPGTPANVLRGQDRWPDPNLTLAEEEYWRSEFKKVHEEYR